MQKEVTHKDNYTSRLALQGREKSKFERFIDGIKNATFAVLFVLLKEEDDGNLLLFIIPTIFDYLQIMQFIFHKKINHLWNASDIFAQVFDLFAFFDLGDYFSGFVTWRLYLITFYFFIFLILFIIIDIAYVSISFNRKKFTAIWPLVILRNFVNIAVTVLFLFITEVLISMIACTASNDGLYRHLMFEDVVCFQGWHIFHTAVSVLFNIIFMTISLIVVLNYFESRISSKSRLARANSKAEFWFVINKITLQIIFAFFSSDWLLSLTIFIGGLYLAYYYVYDDPFYNSFIAKFYKILSSLYFWSCCVILILKLLSMTSFEGGFILWIAGIPFVVLISVSFDKNSIKTINNSHIKYKRAQDLIDHIHYVLKLIEGHESNKQYYLFLIGYIQKHKEMCLETDCPLKLVNSTETFTKIDFKESLRALIQVIDRLYELGIKKFKRSIQLRISYAFFLLERMDSKKKALYELRYAEDLRPPFDKEFLIYRYKKMIEDSLNDNTKINGEEQEVDVVGLIAFETHLKMVVYFVKRSAEYHKDFWSELLKERSDLTKLSALGTNINFTIKNAKENWNKLIKINNNIPSVLKLYSRFLTLVLNEKDNGKKLMNQFKQLIFKQKDMKLKYLVELKKLPNTTALAFVSYHNNEMGYIKRINTEFMALLGYTEEDIINQRVEVIIPEVYRPSHPDYINDLLKKSNPNDKYLENERSTFCKNKQGFLIPVKTKVALMFTDGIVNNAYFILSIKPEVKLENNLFLFTDKDGYIQEITSNVVSYLDLSIQKINERRVRIDDYLPRAIVLHDYRVKGLPIALKLNDGRVIEALGFMQPVLLKQAFKAEDGSVIITKDRELEGYIAKIDLRLDINVSPTVKNQLMTTEHRVEGFKVDLDIWTHIPGPFANVMPCKRKTDEKNLEITNNIQKSEKNYVGRRIITKRLQNGEITSLAVSKFYEDDMRFRSDIIKESISHSVFKDKVNYYEKQNAEENNKIRKDQLNSIIIKENKSSLIFCYKIFSIVWFIILLSIGILQINRSVESFDILEDQMRFIQTSSQQLDCYSSLFARTIILGLTKRKILHPSASDVERREIMNDLYKSIDRYTTEVIYELKNNNRFPDGVIYKLLENDKKLFKAETGIGERLLTEAESGDEQAKNSDGADEGQEADPTNEDTNDTNDNKNDSEEDNKDQIENSENDEDKTVRNKMYTRDELFVPLTFVNITDKKSAESNHFDQELLFTERDFSKDSLFDRETGFNSYDFNIHYIITMINKLNAIEDYKTAENFVAGFPKIRNLLTDIIFDSYLPDLRNHVTEFKRRYRSSFYIDKINLLLLGASLFATLLFLAYIYKIIKIVYLKIETVLTLFLDIPRKEVIEIEKRCDAFIAYSTEFSFDSNNQKRMINESSDEEEEIDKEIQTKVDKFMKKKTEEQHLNRCMLIRFG